MSYNLAAVRNNKKNKFVLSVDTSKKSSKKFYGFDTINSMIEHYEAIEGRKNHYELCLDSVRKMYFDIDSKQIIDLDYFIEETGWHFKEAFEELFDIDDLDITDIVYTNSTVKNKFSVHICILGYKMDRLDNQRLAMYMNELALEEFGIELYDLKVYTKNQNFRMLHSSKYGKKNKKVLVGKPFDIYDTLISDTTDCVLLEMPAVEVEPNEPNEVEVESEPIEPTFGPNETRNILFNLSSARYEEYDDWLRVVLACLNSGVSHELIHEWSAQSEKYDIGGEEKLNDIIRKHRKRKTKSITMGSVRRMLKQDNATAYNQLFGISSASEMITESDLDSMKQILPLVDLGEEEFAAYSPVEQAIDRVKKNKPFQDNFKSISPETYNERYCKPFEFGDNSTYCIKAPKGAGKSKQVIDYIAKHNPEYVIYLSFRRTLTADIYNLLNPLGFENYLDITDGIDDKHKRIIISPESIYKIQWSKKPDLFILDECESIRVQLHSPTVKFSNSVMSNFKYYLKYSERVICMDADFSQNTYKIISQVRDDIKVVINESVIQQSKFNDYYIEEKQILLNKIYNSLDDGKKIVICSNQGADRFISLRDTIQGLYPDLKIRLYNSKTMLDKETAQELTNVDKNWVKYDVIMYSGTIQAGVSFNIKNHFHSCFCWFNSNVKVNALRQSMNRVRHFIDNNWYIYLNKMSYDKRITNYDEFKKHMASLRYISNSSLIQMERNETEYVYDFNRLEYQMYIYNEIEKNIDSNNFISRFITEQYNSGVNINLYSERIIETDKPKLTQQNINAKLDQIRAVEYQAIAAAEDIPEDVVESIKNKLTAGNVLVEASQIHSLKKYNLKQFYAIDNSVLDKEFVEIYSDKSVKKHIKLHHKIKKSDTDIDSYLKTMKQDEVDAYDNRSTKEESSPIYDLTYRYNSKLLKQTYDLMSMTGFKSFDTEKTINSIDLEKTIQDNLANYNKLIPKINLTSALKTIKSKPFKEKQLRGKLDFINKFLNEAYGIKIKQTRPKSKVYHLYDLSKYFKYKTTKLNIPLD